MSSKLAGFAVLAGRLGLATSLIYHGLRNATTMFGGSGLASFTHYLDGLGVVLPELAGPVLAFGQILAGLGLALGFMHHAFCWIVVLGLVLVIWFEERHAYSLHAGGCEQSLALIALAMLVATHGPGPFAYQIKRSKG